MKESLRTFMNGLIDYAGLFPPADLPLNEAIEEKKKDRGFLGHKPVRVVHDVNKTQ